MQKFAVWLTTRPMHAILASLLLFLPALPLSAAVCLLTWLARGRNQAVLVAATTTGLIGAATLIRGFSPVPALLFAGTIFGVALASGWLVERTRSVTLAAQVLVLLALAAIVVVESVGPPPEVLWAGLIDTLRESLTRSGVPQADEVVAELVTPFVSGIAIAAAWLGAIIALYAGYGLYGAMPDNGYRYGRFSELNFGRVLAAVMVVVSILAAVTEQALPRGLALVLLIAFALGGLSLAHWVVHARRLPPATLLLPYVMIVLEPTRGAALLMLAVAGYIDAWFNVRGWAGRSGQAQ